MNVVAQNVLEGRVEQMGGGVRAAHALAALCVDARLHGLAKLEAAGDDLAGVHILAALVLLHVGDFKFCVAAGDDAVVGHLAAHLGVERGLVEHDDALHAGHHLLGLLALDHQRDELRVVDGVVVVADKLGGRNVLPELDARPAEVAERLARLAGAGSSARPLPWRTPPRPRSAPRPPPSRA